MPRIIKTEGQSNIIRIEPSPNRKCSVKVKMETINTSGGEAKYITGKDGKKKVVTSLKDPKNLQRLPGTVVEYCAALGSTGLQTGLDELVTNPYKDLAYYKPGWETILKGHPKIRRQELLEYKHNKEKGYYSNQVNGTISSKDLRDAPFYLKPEARCLLNDGVTYLDLNNPNHEANYYMLKAHPMIANSYEELMNSSNPDITHYIVDEKEKEDREATEVRKMHKFGKRLEDLMELNDHTIVDFYKAMAFPAASGASKNEAYKELNAAVERSEAHYDEFMAFYNMWEDLATRDVFQGYVELYDLLKTPGLITQRGNKLFWSEPANEGGKRETWEWKSKEQFIREFLLDPRYQDEVEKLRAQFRAKIRYV